MNGAIVYVVGIGPGGKNHLSPRARAAIKKSQIVVGYSTYIAQLTGLLAGKRIIHAGMTRELERAAAALEQARRGACVALVSGGDAGIYGMAGPALESLRQDDDIRVEVIPGITALSGCAALLGAPIMNDFAAISLSDLLTGRAVMERRIKYAAQGDFVIVFYNPKSKNRARPLLRARDILLRHKSSQTVVGIARNATRGEEKKMITDLQNMFSFAEIDMATTIIVGNSQTYVKITKNEKYMITPRGYKFASPSTNAREYNVGAIE